MGVFRKQAVTAKGRSMPDAFNKWMDDFINNPSAYEKTTESALHHLREKLNGEPLTYGQSCEAILQAYLAGA